MGLTNAGKAVVAALVGDVSSPVAFTYVAYGTGTTAFAATQTALVTESQRSTSATVTRATTTVANDTLSLANSFTIATTETITEAGVFNDSSAGTMLARSLVSPTKGVSSGDTYVLTYKIAFA